MTQLRRITAVAALTAPLLVLAPTSASAEPPCIPHVNSKGPTIYLYPDYSDPTKSDYAYDASGTYIEVDLCLEG